MKTPFTIYRCTNAFMSVLNHSAAELNLHRARTCSFGDDTESVNTRIQAVKSMLNNKQLIPVATVNCEPNRLFEVTNTISQNWTHNNEVNLLPDAETGFLSSSSVGDIFSDAEDRFFMYGPFSVIELKKEDILPV